MRPSILFLGLLALGGCAGGPGGVSNYEREFISLTETCRERGGILSPTGRQSGRPQEDNVCRITGVPSPRVGG